MNQICAIHNLCQQLFNIWSWFGEPFVTTTRSFMERGLAYYLPARSSGLVSSMIFGGSDLLAADLRHYFSVIGMQHVTAASGFNVGLMSTLASGLLSRFCHRRISGLFSLGIIWLYVGWAHASASVLRAGLMLSFTLVGNRLFYRQINTYWSLLLAVMVMLLISPQYLTDIGFQLSVSSTLGLLAVTPLLIKHSWWKSLECNDGLPFSPSATSASSNQKSQIWRLLSVFKDAGVTTCAAQSLSLPLLLLHFQEFSALSLLANMLLLWLTPLITLGGVLLIVMSTLAQVWSFVFNFPAHMWGMCLGMLTDVFIFGVSFLGQWENTLLKTPEVHLSFVGVWWLAIFAVIFWVRKRSS